MTEELTALPLHGAAEKAATLLARDLAMMATAAKYNLAVKADQTRSVSDLARLFFHIAKIIEVDLFVECGAKDAETSRRARRVLDPKRVVAFEANPYTFKKYRKLNVDPALGVEYLHTALSDSVGTVTFNVLRTDDGRPRADGQASLLQRQNELEKGFVQVSVDATTVDTFFAGHEYQHSAFWIDVEGAARVVLPGAREMLDRASVVMIEVEDRRYWGDEQWLREDVVSYLYDRGLVPIARDFQSRYQSNIVFARQSVLDVDRVRWALTLFSSTAYAAARSDAPNLAVAQDGWPGRRARAQVLARRVAGRGVRELRKLRSKP